MEIIKDIDIIPSAEQFNASSLLQVGMTYKKGPNSWSRPFLNNRPANVLFDNLESVEQSNNSGYLLHYTNGQTFFLEKSTEGVEYRLWNKSNKDDASSMKLLVVGSEQRDLFNVNLAVGIEHLTTDTVIVHNLTEFNGMLWSDTPFNQELRTKGFQWYLHGVSGGDFPQGDFIANDNSLNFNTGNGDKRFCIITTDPNVPILKKSEINAEGSNGAHYFLDFDKEVSDKGIEYLTLIAYTRTKTMHRGRSSNIYDNGDLNISITQLFPNKIQPR